MSDELKPCPFCGGKAEVGKDLFTYYVWCVGCDIDNMGREYGTEKAAVESWNRRALSDPAHEATKERLLRGVHALAKGDTYEQDYLMQMLGGAMILSAAADKQHTAAPQGEPHER